MSADSRMGNAILGDSDTLARPYPARIAELERIVDQLTSESAKYQRELVQSEAKLESTRQQYVDADHAANLWHAECKLLRSQVHRIVGERGALRSDVDRLEREIAKLQFESSQDLAENANLILANDHLKQDGADLHQQLAALRDNAKKQADVIRAQEAESERLKAWYAPRGNEFDWAAPEHAPDDLERS